MGRLTDSRVRGRCSHYLPDIVVLAIVAIIGGTESYDSIEEFGTCHYELLKTKLRLPNGIPSHDTINRAFQAINFRQFEFVFSEWAKGLTDKEVPEKVIAIDGKTEWGSKDTAYGRSPIHLVHAWSVECSMCLRQYKTEAKSNEITAIPELLDLLCVNGAIITIDTMGTQRAIAEKNVSRGGDYALALKGNQRTMRQDAEHLDKTSRHRSESEDVDKGHGRVDVRHCQIFEPDEYFKSEHPWPGLRTIVKIHETRYIQAEDKEAEEIRYYLSRLKADQPIHSYIRDHWAVENSLHWTLDMTFREDQQRKRAGMAAENFALARMFALNDAFALTEEDLFALIQKIIVSLPKYRECECSLMVLL